MLRLIEELCWLATFLATVAMKVLLEVMETFAKWCKRMYLSIEVYVRMFLVRMAWLLIQLLRLSIAFSPAIGAYLTYVLFWPHPSLLWSAIGWAALMLIMGIVLSSTLSDRIQVHTPTPQEFSRMERSFTADLFISVFRCMPGVLAIVYSHVAPATIVTGCCFWSGITWMVIVVGVQVVIWLNRNEVSVSAGRRGWIPPDERTAEDWVSRAEAHRMKGNYDQAIEDLTRAIELDPKDSQRYEWRAKAYEARGDADKAAQDRAEAERLKAQTA
ncbi:MAG: tetratricopeptide repeat protein [Candidatus Peribacteraceae bacterium]|nr:tetratricopeptide repeat protein [Candidatus Peribacteraceae bacterium]